LLIGILPQQIESLVGTFVGYASEIGGVRLTRVSTPEGVKSSATQLGAQRSMLQPSSTPTRHLFTFPHKLSFKLCRRFTGILPIKPSLAVDTSVAIVRCEFSWDESKRESVLQEWGIDFLRLAFSLFDGRRC
jgi:hypothetical protein